VKWKQILAGIVFVLIVISSFGIPFGKGNPPKDSEEGEPFLNSDEVADFLVAMGADRETISKMDIPDIYRSDISDDFLEWANLSRDEAVVLIKDMFYQVIISGPQALKEFANVLPSEPPRAKLDFGSKTLDAEREKSSNIAVYGKIPEFKNQEERWEWMDKLGEVDHAVEKIVVGRYFPPGPVGSSGIGNGYMIVSINKEAKGKESLSKEIYALFDEAAKKKGIMDIPVVFEECSDTKVIEDSGRDTYYRPIRGGIQVENLDLVQAYINDRLFR
jgi:hypothetical protein